MSLRHSLAGSAASVQTTLPAIYRALPKPSSGLEPETPSLPCEPDGHWWQTVANDSAGSSRFPPRRRLFSCHPWRPRFSRTFPSATRQHEAPFADLAAVMSNPRSSHPDDALSRRRRRAIPKPCLECAPSVCWPPSAHALRRRHAEHRPAERRRDEVAESVEVGALGSAATRTREVDRRLSGAVVVGDRSPAVDQSAILVDVEDELDVLRIKLERHQAFAREVLNFIDFDDHGPRGAGRSPVAGSSRLACSPVPARPRPAVGRSCSADEACSRARCL
jgi:hypothetical protein